MQITYEWNVRFCGMLATAKHNDKYIKQKIYADDLTIKEMKDEFERLANERLAYLESIDFKENDA